MCLYLSLIHIYDIWGAETNVKNMGRHEDLFGEYEREIIDIVQTWN